MDRDLRMAADNVLPALRTEQNLPTLAVSDFIWRVHQAAAYGTPPGEGRVRDGSSGTGCSLYRSHLGIDDIESARTAELGKKGIENE